jgi:hypothetical protein
MTDASNEDEDRRSSKIVKFNPESGDDYGIWEIKFTALATIKNYDGVLDGTDKVPIDTKVTTDAEELRLRKANRIAYGQLILSCEGDAFPYVRDARTTGLPKGDARLAWISLQSKYAPKEKADRVDKIGEFTKCGLEEPGEDPDKWFQTCSALN